MPFPFYKMHGLKNDFVVLLNFDKQLLITADLACTLADRKSGIGCDQILILETNTAPDTDFFFRIFNADGSESGQCGNGARCLGLLIETLQLKNSQTQWQLQTNTTQMTVRRYDSQSFEVELPAPVFCPQDRPIQAERSRQSQIQIDGKTLYFDVVDVGNPHAIIMDRELYDNPNAVLAKKISEHPIFPERTNVNFVKIINKSELKLKVYERGAGFTQACGSGACASFAVGRKRQLLAPSVTITQPGGALIVTEKSHDKLLMRGPAQLSYTGTWGLKGIVDQGVIV
jgi:diaminopimelate epimerase